MPLSNGDDSGEAERTVTDVLTNHSRVLLLLMSLEDLKKKEHPDEPPGIHRFELARFTLSNDERRLSQLNRGDRIKGRTDKEFQKRRAQYLQSMNKYFWNDPHLTRTLKELKEHGIISQPHRNGPYSSSTTYELEICCSNLVEDIKTTSRDKITLLEKLGVICGIRETPGSLELSRIEDDLESAMMRLHILKVRTAIEGFVRPNAGCREDEVRARLLVFILLFLRTMRDRALGDDGREFRAQSIIADPRGWISGNRLLPPGGKTLRDITLINLVGPEMVSILTDSDWEALAWILKRYGFNYDFEAEGLPHINSWEYGTFLGEYDRPLVVALQLGFDLVHPTMEQLSRFQNTLRETLMCENCEHRSASKDGGPRRKERNQPPRYGRRS